MMHFLSELGLIGTFFYLFTLSYFGIKIVRLFFDKFRKNGVNKVKLNSIKDNKKFGLDSVKILYSLPINTFTLIADDQNNVFIAKTISYESQKISKDSVEFNGISNEASAQNRNDILKSYDYLLNNKYKVIVNEKVLDRVKNYFR